MNVKKPSVLIKYKILFLMLSVQLVGVGVFIYAFIQTFKSDKTELVYDLNSNTVKSIKEQLDQNIRALIDKMSLLTQVDASGKQLLNLNNIFSNDAKVLAVYQYDITATPSLETKFEKDVHSNFQKNILQVVSKIPNNKYFFWKIEGQSKNVLGFAFKAQSEIMTTLGTTTKVVKAFFGFVDLDYILKEYNDESFLEILVLNKENQLIFHNKEVSQDFIDEFVETTVFKKAQESQNTLQISTFTDSNKKKHLVSIQQSSLGEFKIISKVWADAAFMAVRQMLTQAILIALVIVFIAALLTHLFSVTITNPLNRLMQIMNEVALGKRYENSNIKSNDEIGVLANAFDHMNQELYKSRSDLENLNADLENKVKERTKQLEELTIKDPLTGAYNRRFFNQKAEEEIQRARRSKREMGIIYMDIDHFKKYNDQNGHPEGDQLLINYVKCVQEATRKTDFFCRLGGEEFCMIVVDTNVEGIKILAEKVRTAIEATDFKFGEKQPLGRVTCSIGYSVFPDHADNLEDLVKASDEALYHAKENGRNQSRMAERKVLAAS